MQAKIMAQIQQNQNPIIENKPIEIPPVYNNNSQQEQLINYNNSQKERQDAMQQILIQMNDKPKEKEAKIIVSVMDDDEDIDQDEHDNYNELNDELNAEYKDNIDENIEENKKNKEKMDKMEEISSQLREIELTRRRLLFTEYPFPNQCFKFCIVIMCLYCFIISFLCIYYGLSFDSTTSDINIQLNNRRMLLQSQNIEWDDINWNNTFFNNKCEFVPISQRIGNELEILANEDSSMEISNNNNVNSGGINEDIRWIIFSFVGLIIGILIWQPIISLIIGILWLYKNKYNTQIILNILNFYLIYIYKSVIFRQLLYIFCRREYIDRHIIDSLILCENNKQNEQKLASRQQYNITLNINGEIIDYAQEFTNNISHYDFHKSHKSGNNSYHMNIDDNNNNKYNPNHSMNISQDFEFDHGNID
eukprot:476007_1